MASTEHPAPRIITSLSEIAGDYDALLVDVWGVIHNGRDVFGEAVEACRRFRAERGPVALISNSPRPAAGVIAQMQALGAGEEFFDCAVTSGDATHVELAARAPGPAFKLGPARDDPLYVGTGLTFAPLKECAFISCTGLFDDERETPADYADMLGQAAELGLEMVCANPDVIVRRGDATIFCGGALGQAYAEGGGRVVYAGKPHAPIYDLAFKKLSEAVGRKVERRRTLAIGDGPDTDIAGANAHGCDALFIAAGIHSGEVLGNGQLTQESVTGLLAKTGRTARYAAARLG